MLKRKIKKHSKFTKNAKYNAIKLDKKLNRKIKKISNMIELKYLDVFAQEGDVAPTGYLQLLNAMTNGTEQNFRLGDQITMTSLQMRGAITAADTQDLPTHVRMIIFMDRQANNAAPSVISSAGAFNGLLAADTLQVATDPWTATYSPFSYEQQKRFRVLYDKRYVLNPHVVGPTTGTYVPYQVKFNVKLKLGKVVKYSDTGNTIADISTNSLYVVWLSDVPNAPEQPTVDYWSRIYFKDA